LADADGPRVHLPLLGAAAVAAILGLSTPALAQVSGNVSVVSDYRLRAASISDRRPAASLTLSDDLENGVYFGGTVVAGEPRDAERRCWGTSSSSASPTARRTA